MSFDDREESRTKGQPVSLYFIRYGEPDEAYYAYTSAEQAITHTFDVVLGPVTFQPVPVTRGEINASGSLDRATLEVRMPLMAQINEVFQLFPPSQVVALVIFDGHIGEPTFKTVWMGRIVGQSYEGEEAVYSCEPASTSLKRPGLQRNWQRGCPLVLYSQGWKKCNADKPSATVNVVVVSYDGAIVTVPNGWDAAHHGDAYIGGVAEWQTADGRIQVRTILALPDTDQVRLNAHAVGMSPGITLSLSLGCSHDRDSCLGLHDNIHNYGGQDWIPTKNPIGIVRNFD